jgi:ketosteroid isomerase-like protein
MSDKTLALARHGLNAWQRGDFASIEAMLDPAVEWRSFEPGEWDCHGRHDVMHVRRERYEQGFARGELEFLDGGPDSVVVVAHPAAIGGDEWPEEVATVITFRDEKVTTMQDYRKRTTRSPRLVDSEFGDARRNGATRRVRGFLH